MPTKKEVVHRLDKPKMYHIFLEEEQILKIRAYRTANKGKVTVMGIFRQLTELFNRDDIEQIATELKNTKLQVMEKALDYYVAKYRQMQERNKK